MHSYARRDKATLFQSVLTTIHYPFGHETHDDSKVHIFLEGHKILQNLHQFFDWQYIGQILGGDFAKFCVAFSECMNFMKEALLKI